MPATTLDGVVAYIKYKFIGLEHHHPKVVYATQLSPYLDTTFFQFINSSEIFNKTHLVRKT